MRADYLTTVSPKLWEELKDPALAAVSIRLKRRMPPS
jgi:hypothetical protein